MCQQKQLLRSLKTLAECKQAVGIPIMATVQDQEKSTTEDFPTVTWNKEAVTVTMALWTSGVQQRPRDARAFLAIADMDMPLSRVAAEIPNRHPERRQASGATVQKNTGRVCDWKPSYLQA